MIESPPFPPAPPNGLAATATATSSAWGALASLPTLVDDRLSFIKVLVSRGLGVEGFLLGFVRLSRCPSSQEQGEPGDNQRES